MINKGKKIAAALCILVVIATMLVYYFWNKPHQEVADANGIKTNAIELYKAFTSDSVAAKKNYTEQILEVTGSVSRTSKNQQNQSIVLIKTASDGAYINCTMEQQIENIKEGNTVSIKGICSGLGQGDADLGILGDLYLVRCYLIK
jgi:hypothetical protein